MVLLAFSCPFAVSLFKSICYRSKVDELIEKLLPAKHQVMLELRRDTVEFMENISQFLITGGLE